MAEPSEADRLGELFRCERFLPLFPTGMPIRACLRRQLDRQVALDGKGRPRSPADWPPCKPFCAVECKLGRQHLEEARAAGIPAVTCLRCGSAQVGSGSAAPCAGCEPDAKEVPRGHLPAPAGPAASSRLWNGEVPDVPIAAPGVRRPPAPVLPRQHHPSTPAPRASVNQEEPAEPAEEETMAKEKPERRTCPTCKERTLRSDNTKGICGVCQRNRKEPPAGQPPARADELAPRRAAKTSARRAGGDLEALATAELLRQREAIDEEMRRRLAVAQDEVVALKAAVGEG